MVSAWLIKEKSKLLTRRRFEISSLKPVFELSVPLVVIIPPPDSDPDELPLLPATMYGCQRSWTLVLSALVALVAVCSADEDCRSHIKTYLECDAQVKDVKDENLPKARQFLKRIEDCFLKSKCMNEKDVALATQNISVEFPEHCVDGLKREANRIQEQCWSKYFTTSTSVLKPVILSIDPPQDELINFDRVIDPDIEVLYNEAAYDALLGMNDLRNASSCSPGKQRQIKDCLMANFDEIAKQWKNPNVFIRTMEAEKRFNTFCKDHQACYASLTPACRRKFDNASAEFCTCLHSQFYSKGMEMFKECSDMIGILLVYPAICDGNSAMRLCQNNFIDAYHRKFGFFFPTSS
ncbi:unnamed protein product [Soboliphyme baturini]|uniref:DUF19 domain-containing protein n=1 Tax=Soboliphyme baturini TaxID=241478 RepID=A0A183IP41_9BILA|nr:unnamed protein product [Soboliphyme baturini]